MSAVERALRDFLAVRPPDVAIALVGGLAVSARVEPRFTRDLVDLAGVADDSEWKRAEAAIELIHQRGFSRGRNLRDGLAELRSLAGG